MLYAMYAYYVTCSRTSVLFTGIINIALHSSLLVLRDRTSVLFTGHWCVFAFTPLDSDFINPTVQVQAICVYADTSDPVHLIRLRFVF